MKLIVENLHLERGSRAVIAGVSFDVQSGEALLLTGPNGAGKTTLLRALAGLFPPATGTITLVGSATTGITAQNSNRQHLIAQDDDATLAERCHFIGHQNGLKSSLTAGENLSFWATVLGATDHDSVGPALERFNLSALETIPAGYLSAGQKRRLGLARLLVAARPIWLLDEPTVSLDQASVALLGAVVNAHVASGGIAIAATHLPLGLANARELQLTPPKHGEAAA